MTRHIIYLVAVLGLSVFSTHLHAEESNNHAYAIMQDCLATGFEVIDNGSYERFCVEQYLATTARLNEE